MIKLLLVGKDSYIEKNLKYHFLNNCSGFIVNSISLSAENWKEIKFGIYDCVIYLGATKAELSDQISEPLNYLFNSHLPFDMAEAAKAAGVSRFVFLSSMDVYGKNISLGKNIIIDKNTPLEPSEPYGKSKLDGENRLQVLADDNFSLIILRLPLVYGPGCPGMYTALKDLISNHKKLPALKNQLSAININTLCAFIQYLLENDYAGIFHPQNRTYISTVELLDMISKELLLPLTLSKWLGFKYNIFKSSCPPELHEFYGSLVYAKDIDM